MLLLVSIFLAGSCPTWVTASESGSGFHGSPVKVTPVDGHLLLDYKQSVDIDYPQVKYVLIDIEVSQINSIIYISLVLCFLHRHRNITKILAGPLQVKLFLDYF